MLLYVDEGEGVGSLPQRTRWPGPPSGSLRPALGWDPVAERWRLQTGQLEHSCYVDLLDLSQRVRLRTTLFSLVPRRSIFCPRCHARGISLQGKRQKNHTKDAFYAQGSNIGYKSESVFTHYWALGSSRGKASIIDSAISKFSHFKRFPTCSHYDIFVFLDLMDLDICNRLATTWTGNDGRVLPPAGHHKKLSKLYSSGSPCKERAEKQKQGFCFGEKAVSLTEF